MVYAELRRDVAQAAARCLAVCLEEMMHGLPEGKNKNAKTLANVTLFSIGTTEGVPRGSEPCAALNRYPLRVTRDRVQRDVASNTGNAVNH